ncbi:HNH endonuclease [Ursidibacter sp. B-7004-1]
MESKVCKDCGKTYPITREFFGQYKNKRSDGSIKIGFRNSCRKCMANNTKEYDTQNPENVLARRMRREKAVLSSGGNYTQSDISILRNKLNDKCRFCGVGLNGGGDIEHLTPVSRGGSSNINNLTLSCYKCNAEKTNKTLNEYLEWRIERGLSVRQVNYSENPDIPSISKGRKNY